MAAILFHEPIFATIVESGDKLYFYQVGTTDDLTVYTDYGLTAAATQPLIANSDGEFPTIYIDSTGEDPKVVLKNTHNEQKWTVLRYPIEDIAALSQGVDDAESGVQDLDGRMSGVEGDIDTLETETADLEQRVTDLESGGEGQYNQEIFTGSGTWEKPTGLSKVKVTVVGGGGGGPQRTSTASPGAGGGCAIKWILAASLGDTESVTVGVGGAGAGLTTASDGGTSSFGAHCSATGGQGGISDSSQPRKGGIGSSGDVNLRGQTTVETTGYSDGGGIPGGGSYFGFGGRTGDAAGPGCGGSTGQGGNGDDGQDGIVIVEEFF